MFQIELEKKKDHDTKNEVAEKLKVDHNANFKTKEDILQEVIAKNFTKIQFILLLVKCFLNKKKN